jgi:mono/diheme cytochrome c family protein
MAKRLLLIAIAGLLIGFSGFYWLTMPERLDVSALPKRTPDLVNGETLFWAGGCASCHAAPGARGDAKLMLAGGVELETPFGTFRAPNISPDADTGIGAWRPIEFVNAMRNGVSPAGSHYYPAFPYANYRRMPIEDLIDLKAFLDTLPKSPNRVADHDLAFPFTVRRGLGLWKLLYLTGEPFSLEETRSGTPGRGRYLVEGPGHCSACHSPRGIFGGTIAERHLGGAPAFEGKSGEGQRAGSIPNITPHADGIGSWSESDIAYSLESGMDPDFDSFGGSMVAVQQNMAKLSPEDRAAIAKYLKSVPPLPSQKP